MGMKEKLMESLAVRSFMDILKEFDDERTVGSIKKSEIKKIIRNKMKDVNLDDMMK